MRKILLYTFFIFCSTVLSAQNESLSSDKEIQTEAISTIDCNRLRQYGADDVHTALYGTLPGLFNLQNLGWRASSKMFIRGAGTSSNKTPLIIVDGFKRSISDLSIEEIENISVLKDGAATAIYGNQGANGAIVINTKRGIKNTKQIEVDYHFGLGHTFDMPTFVNAEQYALAINEANLLDGLEPRYSEAEVAAFKNGTYPEYYPNVNWLEEGLRDYTTNHELGVTFRGGGKRVAYFTHINYQNNMGLLDNTDENSKFSTQMRRNKLSGRMNLDIDITNSTVINISLLGFLDELHRPAGDGNDVKNFYRIPSLAFPIKTEDGHWGGNDFFGINPIAEVADKGYYNVYSRKLLSDVTISQDLSTILEGWSAQATISYDNSATYQEGNNKSYSYEVNLPTMLDDGTLDSVSTSIFGEDKSLSYWSGLETQYINYAINFNTSYKTQIDAHKISAKLDYRQEKFVPLGRNSTRKYQHLALLANYDYDSRFFVDVVANYDGSSVLFNNHRFTMYPSVSAAWLLSNEDFMRGSSIDYLKLRTSFGRSGLTPFGYDLDKQFYAPNGNYFFGDNNSSCSGLNEGSLPMKSIKPEIANKFNFGVDFSLRSHLNVTADAFYEKRTNIMMGTGNLYSSVLGVAPSNENIGEVSLKGLDASLSYKNSIGDFKYNAEFNLTYSKSEILKNNEGYVAETFHSTIGTAIGQFYGLEAIGFFNDFNEIDSSPEQTFSAVRPGDIKYRDVNDDGVINRKDFVKQGYSTLIPEIYYGINLGGSWKGLGFNLQFQGVGNYSKMLAGRHIYYPLVNNSNLSTWYTEDNVRWTEETKDIANLPRMSTIANDNNSVSSSLWLCDASYFTLRNAVIYYDFPKKVCDMIHLKDCRIYLKGDNLFRKDHIKYSNPDNPGTLYPDIRTLYAGMKIRF